MKIQSRFKDYYDHISHRVGADPQIVYVREPLRREMFGSVEIEWPGGGGYFNNTLAQDHFVQRKRVKLPENVGCEMEFIVAGSRVVPYIRNSDGRLERVTAANEWRLRSRSRAGETWRTYRDNQRSNAGERAYPEMPAGERLHELIRAVGAPVFKVLGARTVWKARQRQDVVRVDIAIPVLADHDFPALVTAEDLWQDIYATLTNVLRTNPDKAPPVTVGEKYRIEAAGFDLKTSFRHPIK